MEIAFPLTEILEDILRACLDACNDLRIDVGIDMDMCLYHKVEGYQWSRVSISSIEKSVPITLPKDELIYLHPQHAVSILLKAQVKIATREHQSFIKGSYHLDGFFYELAYDSTLQTGVAQRYPLQAQRDDSRVWEINFMLLTKYGSDTSLRDWVKYLRLFSDSPSVKIGLDDNDPQLERRPQQILIPEDLELACPGLEGRVCLYENASEDDNVTKTMKIVYIQGHQCLKASAVTQMMTYTKYLMGRLCHLYGLSLTNDEITLIPGGHSAECRDAVQRRAVWRDMIIILRLPESPAWQRDLLKRIWPPFSNDVQLGDLCVSWRSFVMLKKDAMGDTLYNCQDQTEQRNEKMLVPALAKALANIVKCLPADKQQLIQAALPPHIHHTLSPLDNEATWIDLIFDIKTSRHRESSPDLPTKQSPSSSSVEASSSSHDIQSSSESRPSSSADKWSSSTAPVSASPVNESHDHPFGSLFMRR